MKKVIGLSLCIICAFTFSAYDWGKKSKAKPVSAPVTQAAPQKNAWDTWDNTNAAQQAVPSATNSAVQTKTMNTYETAEKTVAPVVEPVVKRKIAKNKVTSLPAKEATPAVSVPVAASPVGVSATTTPASDKAVAIVTLAKIVGSGTPEERKARIESLKRLSQALAKSQGQQPQP